MRLQAFIDILLNGINFNKIQKPFSFLIKREEKGLEIVL